MTQTNDGRAVEGGAAKPVYLVNVSMPRSSSSTETIGTVKISQEIPGSTNAVALGMRVVGTHIHVAAAAWDTVQSLTAPAGAYGLLLQCSIQNVKYTIDGTTAPTAGTTGVGASLKKDEQWLLVPVVPGLIVKVIAEVAGAAAEMQWTK